VELLASARRVGQKGRQAAGRTRFRRGQLDTCRRCFLQNAFGPAARPDRTSRPLRQLPSRSPPTRRSP
jgi:hypothetical protein